MKTDYTLYIYKADKRCKFGWRTVSTSVWCGRDKEGMQREVAELQREMWPPSKGYRMEFYEHC